MNLEKNKKSIFEQVHKACVAANRLEENVKVVAVTKHVDISTASALLDIGIKHLAENRVDKFLEKYEALKDRDVTWHLIGSLQRRKVKDVINHVDYFHALDSLNLAKEIQKRAAHPINCFLQVNISGEESKHGFSPDEVNLVLPQIAELDKIRLVGLMTMAPLDADSETIHNIFEQAAQLRQELQQQDRKNMPFTELSMGMSNDYEIAIQHGATFVRIGTSFFK
ncbi:pyridoxaL 5'-phosphate dependent enzyme class III family [Streptococcus pseudoporcinus]|uniref:Pyridoxal phosphate homeostasis protein n=1 Tax=Streptococcus pseudoporcinus TaxID=361101 RepID=A0A4U9YYT1_9STRE|nr:YggS family pyridoxal phosphate-dependent enzyme [Streptococcus pseudoporcinus]VTS32488.1 pyridoxaL 5'-phosphate dependent enzyme class III family [Streptococcus pseudoporcinus]